MSIVKSCGVDYQMTSNTFAICARLASCTFELILLCFHRINLTGKASMILALTQEIILCSGCWWGIQERVNHRRGQKQITCSDHLIIRSPSKLHQQRTPYIGQLHSAVTSSSIVHWIVQVFFDVSEVERLHHVLPRTGACTEDLAAISCSIDRAVLLTFDIIQHIF